MMAASYRRRKRRNVIWTVLAYAATALGLSMTIILATLLWNGIGGLSLDVFTKNTALAGKVVGGLLNSIIGECDDDRDWLGARRADWHSCGHISGRIWRKLAARLGRALHQ